MSDWGELFTSFYNQFILRDLLSMMLPGLTVIFVYSLFFNEQKFSFLMFKIFENSWISVLFVLAMAYFIGVIFIGISDRTGWFKTYYTDLPDQYQEITKKFIGGLSSRDEKTRERYHQIRVTMEYSDKEKKIVKDLKFKMRLIGTYPPYHPANCERIEFIRKKFPD